MGAWLHNLSTSAVAKHETENVLIIMEFDHFTVYIDNSQHTISSRTAFNAASP